MRQRTRTEIVYGSLDDGAATAERFARPPLRASCGSDVQVELATTALQQLNDAFIYLVRYPHECAEQVSSRMLGVITLGRLLSALHTGHVPSATELSRSVEQVRRHRIPS